MIKKTTISLTLLLFQVINLSAQNTLHLEDGMMSPSASVEDLSWLEGHWIADALGGTAEEYWASPKAGAMMGMFRSERGGEISFYEFIVIREVDESLLLQIKHFQRDMVGWEEKDETVDFPLVKLENRTAWFDGLTMKMADENHLTVYVRTVDTDGNEGELVFPYQRVE